MISGHGASWQYELIFILYFYPVDLCVCRFINYCIEEKGYTGYDISNLEETDAVVERLLALNIREEIIGKTWL